MCANILKANSERLPTLKTMGSAYPKEKEQIYFQMTKVEAATVFITAARTNYLST